MTSSEGCLGRERKVLGSSHCSLLFTALGRVSGSQGELAIEPRVGPDEGGGDICPLVLPETREGVLRVTLVPLLGEGAAFREAHLRDRLPV